MRRQLVTSLAAAMVIVSGAGCTGSWDRCPEGDAAVVEQIMAHARTDFRPVSSDGSQGVQIDRLEAIESSVGRLAEKDRKFGADQLLVLSTWTVLGQADASDGFGRIRGEVLFALDADGKLIGPVDDLTASLFDVASPKDAEWLKWGDEIIATPLFSELVTCVSPD